VTRRAAGVRLSAESKRSALEPERGGAKGKSESVGKAPVAGFRTPSPRRARPTRRCGRGDEADREVARSLSPFAATRRSLPSSAPPEVAPLDAAREEEGPRDATASFPLGAGRGPKLGGEACHHAEAALSSDVGKAARAVHTNCAALTVAPLRVWALGPSAEALASSTETDAMPHPPSCYSPSPLQGRAAAIESPDTSIGDRGSFPASPSRRARGREATDCSSPSRLQGRAAAIDSPDTLIGDRGSFPASPSRRTLTRPLAWPSQRSATTRFNSGTSAGAQGDAGVAAQGSAARLSTSVPSMREAQMPASDSLFSYPSTDFESPSQRNFKPLPRQSSPFRLSAPSRISSPPKVSTELPSRRSDFRIRILDAASGRALLHGEMHIYNPPFPICLAVEYRALSPGGEVAEVFSPPPGWGVLRSCSGLLLWLHIFKGDSLQAESFAQGQLAELRFDFEVSGVTRGSVQGHALAEVYGHVELKLDEGLLRPVFGRAMHVRLDTTLDRVAKGAMGELYQTTLGALVAK